MTTGVIDSGKLDRQITILSRPTAVDSLGQPTGANTTVGVVWAAYRPKQYRHTDAAGREVTVAVDRFEVRYRADIVESMLVQFGGYNYEIDRVEEIGRASGLLLHCRRVR